MFIATRSITKIRPPIPRRLYSSGQETNAKAGHARVYTNIIPAMVPVFLLGSAVYLGLELTHLKLSHEKYMEEATKRIQALESEIEELQQMRREQHQQHGTSSTPSSSWWWR